MPSLRTIIVLALTGGALAMQAQSTDQASAIRKKYPPDKLKEDAVLFSDIVLAMHPSIGIYKPREYYVRLFGDLVRSITDSLTEKEFRVRLKLVADELHCGHTEILHSQAFYKEISRVRQNFSPYIFIPVQDRVYLLATLNKQPDSLLKKGTEITRINGIATDSMLRYARRFISSDGYVTTAKDHYLQLGFNSAYTGLFGRPDTFNVEVSDGKTIKNVKYAAVRPKAMPSLPFGPRNDSLLTRFRRAAVGYRFLDPDNKTMLVRIERFANVGKNRAYRKIFRKLRKNRSENLVIDLRNNGGGNLMNSYRLLSYLINEPQTQTLRTRIRKYPYKRYTKGNVWFRFTRLAYKVAGTKKTVNDTDHFIYTIRPRKRNHFGGKIFVLINGGSFSASSLVAAYLKGTGRAYFIGEETGGTGEGCNAGITPYYRLPNTKLRIRMPAFRVVHDVSPQITGKGVMPDYRTQYTFRDIVTRQDLEMKKVKELLGIQ
jgi:hypothetical protein